MNNLLNKRILVAEKESHFSSSKTVREYRVLELSPSGNWIKLMNDNGQRFWRASVDIVPIEILSDKEKHPESK